MAEVWLKSTDEEVLNATLSINGSKGTWPFKNVTQLQFLELLHYMKTDKYYQDGGIMHIYGSLFSLVGAFFSITLIATLYRKAIIQRNAFYKSMMFIACIDLTFCICDFIYNIVYRRYKLYGGTSYNAMWAMIVLRGTVYSLSLISDMFTALLTLDRYLAVTRPQLHKTVSEKRRIILPITFITAPLLGFTRMHFAMDKTVKPKGALYFYTSSEFGSTSFVVYLTMFSDLILPVILLVSMLGLSILFLVSVVKRRQNRVKAKAKVTLTTRVEPLNPSDEPLPPIQKPIQEKPAAKKVPELSSELKAMITLTLALDALFLMNQIGYCMEFAAELLVAHYSRLMSFDGTYDDLYKWIFFYKYEAFTNVACCLGEILSHGGSNFLLYVIFSGSVRREFYVLLRNTFRKCHTN